MTRTRTVADAETRAAVVEEYVTRGYDVLDESGRTTRLRTRDHGGWKAHLLLFVLAPIIGNVAYAAYRRHATTDVVEVTIDA